MSEIEVSVKPPTCWALQSFSSFLLPRKKYFDPNASGFCAKNEVTKMPSCHWLCWASPAFPAASSAHYNPRNSTAPVVGLVPGRSIGQEHGSRFRNELRGRAPRTGGPRLHRHAPPSCRPRLAKSNAREDRETVLVTGAAGFIGANVVEQFLR